jgi:hypothetical protein
MTSLPSPESSDLEGGSLREDQQPRDLRLSPDRGPANGIANLSGPNMPLVTRVDVGEAQSVPILSRSLENMQIRMPTLTGTQPVRVWSSEGNLQFSAGSFTFFSGGAPCHRNAWLTLDTLSLPLEDDPNGYVCAELDIGWPDIREVMNNIPDGMGVNDRTRYFGARLISARLVAGPWGARTMDEIVRAFGPFFQPGARPVFHYTTDTPTDDFAERTMVVRAASFSAPISGAQSRELHCAWVAADPIIRGAATRNAIARPFTTLGAGRTYPLTFERTYASGESAGALAFIVSPGEADIYPRVRIFGPIQAPSLILTVDGTPTSIARTWAVRFRQTYRLDTLRFADIDTGNHTIVDDTGARLEGQVDWTLTTWSALVGNNRQNRLQVSGTNTDHNTQALVTWTDGYLTP